MKSFTDSKNRKWIVNVDFAAIKRVQALCNLDLTSIISVTANGKPNVDVLSRLGEDVLLAGSVLYAICKPECDTAGISEDDFYLGLNGDVLETATETMLNEIVDFFPEAKRLALRKIMANAQRINNRARKELMQILDSPEFEKLLDQQIEQLFK